MWWYDAGLMAVSYARVSVLTGALVFLARKLFAPRFRFAALLMFVCGVFGVYWLRVFLLRFFDTALAVDPILCAFSLLLLHAFYQGQNACCIYVAFAHGALNEIAYLAAYVAISTAQPYLNTLAQRLATSGMTGEQLDNMVYATALGFEAISVGIYGGLLFVLVYLAARSFPSERPLRLSNVEARLIWLPFVCAILLVAMFRILGSETYGYPPQSTFDRYPNLLIISAAILATLAALILGSIQSLTRLRALNTERVLRQTVETQLGALKEQVRLTESQQTTTRRLRHDLQNTITVVEALAQKDPQALRKYLQDLNADTRSAVPEYKTGSVVADALLTSKAQLLSTKAPGVCLDASHFVLPADCTISEYDLGIILSNALDNAIEAICALLGKRPNAEVFANASCFTDGRHLVLHFENSCLPLPHPSSGLPKSTKTQPGHGIGLESIRTIAEKYSGVVDCKTGEVFELAVMLELPADQQLN